MLTLIIQINNNKNNHKSKSDIIKEIDKLTEK